MFSAFLPKQKEFTYSDWTPCTETCGQCTQTKTLKITKEAANGGVACPTEQTISRTTNLQPCAVDCVCKLKMAYQVAACSIL